MEVSEAAIAGGFDEGLENTSLLKQLTVGTVVDGKYRVDEVLGRGAMGVVVAATHVLLKERVALKFLHAKPNAVADDFFARFQREAQVSAKLKNEHIARVIDVGVWKERAPYMVMEHLSGLDLRQTLKIGKRLPLDVALEYIVQVCEGMAEAHAMGVVHRDLKPSNLFVTKRADGSDLIKVLDFGISKVAAEGDESEELTQAGVVLGSPKYMAPEQLFGSATVDARADVWSIGAIFYELVAGRPPFDSPSLARMVAELAADRPPPSLRAAGIDVPDALEAVLFRCFAREREARVQNVADLAGEMLDAVDAPFAAAVRGKIMAMLDPRTARDGMTSSGARALGTGSYQGMASSIMSASSGAMRAQKRQAELDIPIAHEAPEKRRRGALVLGLAIGGAVAILGMVAVSRNGASTDLPAAASLPAQAPATVTALPARGIVDVTPNAAAPIVSATTTSSAAPAATPDRPSVARSWSHPSHTPPKAAAQPAPVAPQPVQTTTLVNTPPPPAAPPAPPSAKNKQNPLEDRQ